ncbi:MAG TPA: hypothetical protein VFY45_18655 [Baekduia sp.]|nr:hypothetical protein [Baekduia sp.]
MHRTLLQQAPQHGISGVLQLHRALETRAYLFADPVPRRSFDRLALHLLQPDFSDVTNVSYSFADEFVGKVSAAGVELEYINMAAPVERSVQRAVARRTGTPVGC